MAAPRNLVGDAGRRDEENAKVVEEEEDWSTGKKPKSERLPLTRWEVATAIAVVLIFSTGLFCIYLTMPAADYGKLKLPRTIADLRLLKYVPNGSLNLVPILKFKSLIFSSLWIFRIILCRDHLASYAQDYPAQFILGYCSTYIFMQTFMIPGTIFMSLLAGALFGVVRGLLLVVFNATAGASSCFFLSKLIGRPLVSWLWPEKLRFFQAEVAIYFLLLL